MTYDWDSVDWSKQNAVIALELGCSAERVRQVRILFGKPKPPNHGKPVTPPRPIEPILAAVAEIGTSMPIEAISRKLRCSIMLISRARAMLGITETYDHYAGSWTRAPIDWRMVNYDIAKIWIGRTDKKALGLACTMRIKHRHKKSIVKKKGWHRRFQSDRYLGIYAQQLGAARKWRKSRK